ncbi:MAG: hypothetical protein KDD62_11710, partial [Bdellovibrionales bacterium]|nr:hypothetical protein [Bdellovibrionales bacterium]
MPKRGSQRYARTRANNTNTVMFAVLIVLVVVLLFRVGSSRLEASSQSPQTQIVAEFDTVRLPVPKKPVPAGTKVKDIELEYIAYPKHQVPEGCVNTIAPYLDAVTLVQLPAQLPLFAKNISLTEHKTNPVVERIPQGMRAITLRVDATSAVEG